MRSKRWTLSVVLGLITAVLLLAVLWPKEEKKVTVAIAARDLGAGTTLAASDLTTTVLAASLAPADAVSDTGKLVGQTLAVVRFAGEPVTPRHLGPAVTLAADERGIAVKVKADTGLAGLLRPGMTVGVIATLTTLETRDVYAKTVLEGLRVLYVPADFQARPYAPATATTTVRPGATDRLGMNSTPPTTTNPGSSGTVREGVLVLAASTRLQPILYEMVVPITNTTAISGTRPISNTTAISGTTVISGTTAISGTVPISGATSSDRSDKKQEPMVRWVVPVELLAALNAAGDSLTLTLLPEKPLGYTTTGVNVNALLPQTEEGKKR